MENFIGILSPKLSAELIAKRAAHVSIVDDGIKLLSEEVFRALKCGKLAIQNFSQNELHPSSDNESAVPWLFLVDTLNFSFWYPEGCAKKWEVTWRGKTYTGYFALCAAVNRAISEGVPMTDAKFCSNVTLDQLRHILRGDKETDVPLLHARVDCLREVGNVLMDKYQGSFVNCLKESQNSAQKLLQLVVDNFPCFRDEAEFEGYAVSFYKRAQILIGDIWACFKGEGLGYFKDIDFLSMFADYRVPQVLVHFGAMKYTDELMELLKSGHILANGSREEVEIRGVSIEVVERVCKQVRQLLQEYNINNVTVNSVLIDHYLWDYRREHADSLEYIPFHKVRCIYY
ncbi:queuosine salvage protein [Schistocerca americana]|uniref:queuosine salvage protein n=1 Tax=Schistocerca americana TaxID=7009 RepID=UPI001F4F6BF6|nr:queuosine salvage protein [Schistocerca americana]